MRLNERRFAFTASYWGGRAVVCRADENRPGPIVEQEFGEFATWTEASAFASKLNEGFDLTREDVRQIVTSAFLATSGNVLEAAKKNAAWSNVPVRDEGARLRLEAKRRQAEARARRAESEKLRWRSVHVQLDLARTCCQIVSCRPDMPVHQHLLRRIQIVIDRATQELLQSGRDECELKGVLAKVEELKSLARHILPLAQKG